MKKKQTKTNKFEEKEKLQEQDEQQSQFDGALLKRAFAFCKPYKLNFLIAFLLLLFWAAFNLLTPYITKVIIDDGITKKDMKIVALWSIIFFVALVIKYFVQKYQTIIFASTASRVTNDIRITLFSHIQSQSINFFNTHEVGRLISRVMGDVDSLNQLIVNGIITFVVDLISTIGVLFIMFRMNAILSWWIVGFMPLVVLVTLYFKKETRRNFRNVRKKYASTTGAISENITGVKVIKSFAREKSNLNHYKRINRELKNSIIKATMYAVTFFLTIEILTYICTAVVFVVGAKMIFAGVLTVGAFAAFIQYIDRFFGPVRNITQFYNILQQAMAGAERIFTILDTESEIQDKPDAHILEKVEGNVEFKNVTFGYTEDKNVLNNVSFTVPKGHTAAFVGPTGAGKSTVINLLARQYDVKDGAILVDGYDVRDVTQKSLREHTGVVLQDSFLFMGTIMENIRYGKPNATDEEVIEAAKTVGIYDFIMSLPRGFKTEIKEGSSNLSTGQKQLIAFARALIADPAILVLDEATSSVDTKTEQMIGEAIKVLFKNRTSFVVAHRLSTIREANCIYVIDQGKILERGSHEELLALCGKYAELCKIKTE